MCYNIRMFGFKTKNPKILILSFLFLICNLAFATNVEDTQVSMHNDSSFESADVATSSVASDEEAIQAYIKEISDAFMSVDLPAKCNLPTQYVQLTFHPEKEKDLFGKVSDDMPIFNVDVENDSTRSNYMCLTFDSAYINTYTYDILDILDEHNIKSTFFMTYEFMEKNPEQIMEIIKRGHEVANHSTTHPDLNKAKDSKVVKEIMKAHNFIKDLVGVDMCLFRFPFGSYSPRTVSLLKNMGYYPIQWTLDSVDWKNTGKDFLINRFKGNDNLLTGGSIILFHNGATYTPAALPEIIEMIYDKGLKCVRVTDLIYQHDFHIMKGKQIKGQFATTDE